ncbi:hypothetical protein IF129_10395 [Streptomyces chumphonensis]|uniref:Uncharacterized protein n=1 Tax=Streptomyces chumphonensis TaxID=1214925 RepID=A0A927ICJ9_9ACTN|nr:hypothetical protein [Streptomyces chumphonensis]MBD3931965.1 hypothetical protein [Streptomyces chumphonensis]
MTPRVLGLDGKSYPAQNSPQIRARLFSRVHYLRHTECLSLRQILDRVESEHGVRRSVGWVSGVLRTPCTWCVQVAQNRTPEQQDGGPI